MAILVILPFLILFISWKQRLRGGREAFLVAAVAWGGMVVVVTEVLSRFDWITPTGLIIAWLAASAVTILMIPFAPRRHSSPSSERLDWLSKSIVGFLAVVCVLLGIVALIGPPNTFDAMTYHLPRVIHWIQDRNVELYPVQSYDPATNPIEFYRAQQVRQLTMAPGAEFIILHLQAITGSERWSAMPQWFAYVGCLIGVWSLAESMGAGRRACALASLFAGTLPMACLQAASTQNDLVCAFWTICFVWLMRNRDSWFHVALCGISMGLTLLTKATAYIYVAPFAVGWLIVFVRRRQWREVANIAVVGIVALLLNLPTYYRNYQFNSTLLGNSNSDLPYANATFTAGNTASNLIRNVALEIAFPPGRVAGAVEHRARWLDQLLGQDPDDLNTTFPFTQFDLSNVNWMEEDSTPSPLHVLLLLAVIASLRRFDWHLAAVAAAFVLLCGYLRWQPWHARLHMVLFMLAAPCAGIAMARWSSHLTSAIAAVLCGAAVIWIAANAHHPLVGPSTIWNMDRDSLRFIERPQLLEPFRAAAAQARGCRQVGLVFSADDWEYPLDMFLKEQDPAVRIETYPQPANIRPRTRNSGWDRSLSPSAVIRFDEGIPQFAGRSTFPIFPTPPFTKP
jgi:4-amino-4-deoxy-L-arabinose transferase-like glycosyltransferase